MVWVYSVACMCNLHVYLCVVCVSVCMMWCRVGIYAYVVCVSICGMCVCMSMCDVCGAVCACVCVVRVFVCGECLCLFCVWCVWYDVCICVPSVSVMWGILRLAQLHQLDQWTSAS